MEKYYCPICGKTLKTPFSHGDICTCCGNESGCDDNIIKEFTNDTAKITIAKAINISFLSQSEAWDYLREKWIKEGFLWANNDFNERPIGWNRNMAIEQLKNINIIIDN
jgi:hypothetical protein